MRSPAKRGPTSGNGHSRHGRGALEREEEDQHSPHQGIVKVIEVLAESPESWEHAARVALAQAESTVRNIRSIYVKDMQAVVEHDEIVSFRLNAKISFAVDTERVSDDLERRQDKDRSWSAPRGEHAMGRMEESRRQFGSERDRDEQNNPYRDRSEGQVSYEDREFGNARRAEPWRGREEGMRMGRGQGEYGRSYQGGRGDYEGQGSQNREWGQRDFGGRSEYGQYGRSYGQHPYSPTGDEPSYGGGSWAGEDYDYGRYQGGQGRQGWSGQGGYSGQGSTYGQGGYGQGGSYGQGGYGQGGYGQGGYGQGGRYGSRTGGDMRYGRYGEQSYGRSYQTGGEGFGPWDDRSQAYRGQGYGQFREDRETFGQWRDEDRPGLGEQIQQFGGAMAGRVKRMFRSPKGYKRSDERIREDVCDQLAQASNIDPSEIEVTVSDGEVTLSGTVSERSMKWQAESIIDSVGGVSEIHNQLRVRRMDQPANTNMGQSSTSSTSSSQTTPSTGRSQARS